MNHIVLIGRLTRDPELRFTPNGHAVANFDLAVERQTTNQAGEREVDFIRVVVWGKSGENCAAYLGKGRMAAIEGRLQIRSYEGKDGKKQWVAEVVASYVQFLDRGKDGSGSRAQEGPPSPGYDRRDLDGINIDDLPF